MYNLLEYGTNYSETTGSLCFILKMKQLILMQILPTQILSKAKVSENTEADNANGILKDATITVPLKYLSNF